MVSNWRPAVAPRLGLDDAALAEANPTLVRVYISGFGATGPLAAAPTYDAVVQAHLGSVAGRGLDSTPAIAGTYVVDKIAASMTCQATLAALLQRERGSAGTRVDISLLDAAAYLNYPDVMANRTFVEQSPTEATNWHAAATRAIRAVDGWIVVIPVTADQIRRAFATVGAPEVADELLTLRDVTTLTTRMMDALEERTRARPAAECVKAFLDNDVPAGACLTIDEHLDDAQVRHNATYGTAVWDELGPVRFVRYPARFSSWPEAAGAVPARPPALGGHTDEILGESVDPR
jgi:crotonobetainyl-CoA:carnitine CoA-transferase CaiB-like acyl-CoA transferase